MHLVLIIITLVTLKIKMKTPFTVFLLFTSIINHAQLSDSEIRTLKSGNALMDTSHIYQLPFEAGERYLLIQAYNSQLSHKNELSLDFKMKKGSVICAARAGSVIAIKEDSEAGGLKETYINEGNHVIILHADGSKALYWHLAPGGVSVQLGDTVSAGQAIGLSGDTGYSAFPHLHFQVVDHDGKEIATRFYTSRGIIYLKPGKYYKR